MAKKAATRKRAGKKQTESQKELFGLEIPIKFGSKAALNDRTCSISCSVSASHITLAEAAKFLNRRRLDGLVTTATEQKQMEGDGFPGVIEIQGVFDIASGVGLKGDRYTFTIAASTDEVGGDKFYHLGNKTGFLKANLVGDIPKETPGRKQKPGKDPEPTEDMVGGNERPHGTPAMGALTQALADNPGLMPLAKLKDKKGALAFRKPWLEKLHEAGVRTVADFEKLDNDFGKTLRFTATSVRMMDEAVAAFRKEHPFEAEAPAK